MEIANHTPFETEALPTNGPEGKPVLTAIVKGTFEIRPNAPAIVAEEQIPIFYGDEFFNAEQGGSVKFESDLVPFKPRADIALIGRAHAPWAEPVRALDVSLRVGTLAKTIRVIGDRYWILPTRLLPTTASKPQPFRVMDLVYERAFGGVDSNGGDVCRENPVGRGFFAKKSKKAVNRALLPNLEDPSNLIRSPDNRPKPVGFGFYGKGWMPRVGYLGTYDEKWQQERCPDPPRGLSL